MLKNSSLFFAIQLLFISTFANSTSLESPDLLTLAKDPAWKALLHFFSESKSEVIAGDFFLSPSGNEDALLELKATLSEFEAPTRTIGILKQKPICAFPARKAWLEKNGFHFKEAQCPDFDRFIESIKPKSLTYVYSSAYPNNPASMFGHTLIRINQGQGEPLLDYGINYAAQVPPGEIGLKYIPKGLLGLYPGQLEIAPYYKKVLEYNESENRDLWEYDLNFSEAEATFFVKHLWEVRWSALYHYTFLKQNCSYQMMRLFEVVRPTPAPQFGNFFYVLPGDTIRTMKQQFPDWFTEVRFRPSHYRIMQNRYQFLTSQQKSEYKKALYNLKETENLTDQYVLETLISYYDYVKIEQQEEVKKEVEDFLRITRVQRAKLGGLTNFPPLLANPNRTNRPDQAHATQKISLTQSAIAGNRPSVGIRGRIGLHEVMDPDAGYEANFGITALDLEAAYSFQKKSFYLRQLQLAQILSLQPLKETHFPLSWRVQVGWDPWAEPFAEDRNAFTASGGVGFTVEPISGSLWLGVFASPSFYIQNQYSRHKWLSLSLDPFVMIRASDNLKFWLSERIETPYTFPRLTYKTSARVTWGISKTVELNAQATFVENSYVLKQRGLMTEFSVGYFF